jgi:hypothetical protein
VPPPYGHGLIKYNPLASLLWTGPFRQVLTSLDLTACAAAIVFDRSNNERAAARQLGLDNRKGAAQRALESPTGAAMLLLLRGVRSAAVTTAATTAWANGQLAQALLRALAAEGLPLSAAASSARGALAGYEVRAAVEAGLVVWGLPHATVADAAAGSEAGRRGAAAAGRSAGGAPGGATGGAGAGRK